jgi:hypothetical protein
MELVRQFGSSDVDSAEGVFADPSGGVYCGRIHGRHTA